MDQNRQPSRRDRRERADGPRVVDVDVAVIGAGSAGLSAAHHLRRAGLVPVGAPDWTEDSSSYVVLDDAPGPGGSWRSRWAGLPQVVARDIRLPGASWDVSDTTVSAREAVPEFLARYEETHNLHVLRPMQVVRVTRHPDRLAVIARHMVEQDLEVIWRARGIINASGRFSHPFWPRVPGQQQFDGRQLHIRDVDDVAALADGHVVLVGDCPPAVHLLAELSGMTTVTWVTRESPSIAEPDLTPAVRYARERGVFQARPMFERIGRRGVWFGPEPGAGWVDGPPFVAARTIVWATGFRPAVGHLAPLHLKLGDATSVDGPQAVDDPRVQIIGSASLHHTERDDRIAVRNLRRLLGL